VLFGQEDVCFFLFILCVILLSAVRNAQSLRVYFIQCRRQCKMFTFSKESDYHFSCTCHRFYFVIP